MKIIVRVLFIALLFVVTSIRGSEQVKPVFNSPRIKAYVRSIFTTDQLEEEDAPAFIAALFDEPSGKFRCTGVVITVNYILTAAHCVIDHKLPYFQYIGVNEDDRHRSDPIIPTDSYILYKPNYDLALLKLKTPYNKPNATADIYHGYSLYSYKPIDISSLDLLGYGDANIPDLAGPLTAIVLQPIALDMDYAQLKATITIGKTFSGDSGGPVSYIAYADAHGRYSKLVGVHSGTTRDGLSIDTILTPDILKWLSEKTGRIIFERPIDQGSISVNNGSGIIFSGWGVVNSEQRIEVYNEANKLVAKCLNVTQLVGNKWSCQAKFNVEYNYHIFGKYQAKFLSKNDVIDNVYFEAIESNIDIDIIHPEDGFTYHTPIGASYVITGSARPRESLIYGLFDKNRSTLIESHPCIDNDLVDEYGLWRCRIKNKFAESSYYFLVKYLKPQQSNMLASVFYNIYPESSLWLNIINPKVDMINSTNEIHINLSKTHSQKEVKFLWHGANFDVFRNNSILINIPANHDEIKAPDEYRDYIYHNKHKAKVYLKVGLYLDGDENASVESEISYYIIQNTISINSLAVIDNYLNIDEVAIITGSATIEDANPKNWEIGLLVIAPDGSKKENGPIAIKDDLTWSGDKYPIKFQLRGKYHIAVRLYNIAAETAVAQSNVSVDIIKKSQIINPGAK